MRDCMYNQVRLRARCLCVNVEPDADGSYALRRALFAIVRLFVGASVDVRAAVL
jgi:hypothetical protein